MVIMTLPLDVGLEVLLVMMHPMRVLVVLLLVLMIYLLLVDSVPQSDDSASGLASVLSSSTGGVSITRRGVNTDGSARNVAGTGRGQGGSRGANVGSAVDGSSNDNASNGGVSGTGENDGFVVSGSASAGGGIGSDTNSNRHARGGDIVIHVSDSENAIVEVEDETHTENDEQPGAVSPALHEPMDEGSDGDVQELTRGGLSSDHEGKFLHRSCTAFTLT